MLAPTCISTLECGQALTHGLRPPDARAVTAGGHGISTAAGHNVERLPHGELAQTRISKCGGSSDDIAPTSSTRGWLSDGACVHLLCRIPSQLATHIPIGCTRHPNAGDQRKWVISDSGPSVVAPSPAAKRASRSRTGCLRIPHRYVLWPYHHEIMRLHDPLVLFAMQVARKPSYSIVISCDARGEGA